MNQLIMRIVSAGNRCSKVPGVRIQPARSSCRRGEFGRSRVEHKERLKAEDTRLNHAPPGLTEEDWGGRGVVEPWFVFLAVSWPDFDHHTRKLDDWEKFNVRALTCSHSWLGTAVIQRVHYFCCCSVLSTVRGSLNSSPLLNGLCSQCKSEQPSPLDFIFAIKTEVASFLPFATNAMEWTYWSVVLLRCIFLDWALLTSAEEGE